MRFRKLELAKTTGNLFFIAYKQRNASGTAEYLRSGYIIMLTSNI